uniref:Phorbol-ester/DAG-type domain-containing protein n=1 Tax=Timema genevievae TaxID=629358 RepID=A0A7R9JVN3_TIMGE|nr:unnamed protein product [Timema genevievae]
MQNLSIAEVTRRLIASESMSDLSGDACLSKSKNNLGRSSWDMDSPRVTPPGTPPPPYGGGCVNPIEGVEAHHEVDQLHEESVVMTDAPSPDVSPLRNSNGSFIHHQHPIIMSMEDDEISDQEVVGAIAFLSGLQVYRVSNEWVLKECSLNGNPIVQWERSVLRWFGNFERMSIDRSQLDDHGPFKSLNKLWEHNAHLAVFMNYVISNSDPSSLLFYLVTDLYKEGNAKEMKKWAYEIHSSFLVPFAPLRLNNVDENVAREIDDVLLKESDKEEILRKIFWKARVKAKEELNEQLADFQQKRTAGLGTIFGPPDAQLDESIHDKSKETKIVESILLPKIEPYLDDIEKDQVDPRRYTTAAALGTVIGKVFGLRGTHASTLLDRCPTFVSKDKSLKARLIGKTRKVNVRGHHFVLHQYYTVTYCNHCQNIIWGIGPQGYQCSDCSLNIHRTCVKVLDENCPGPLTKKEKGNDRISKLMEKIRPEREARRKPSSLALSQFERMKRHSEDDTGALTDGESGTGE